jgi:hypothetical protein
VAATIRNDDNMAEDIKAEVAGSANVVNTTKWETMIGNDTYGRRNMTCVDGILCVRFPAAFLPR